MTLNELLVHLYDAPAPFVLRTLASWIAVILVVNVLHECGHAVNARICGVRPIEFRIGKGRSWHVCTFQGCAIVLGILPVGGSVTYGPGITKAGRLKRALIAAGGACAETLVLAVAVTLACQIRSGFGLLGGGGRWSARPTPSVLFTPMVGKFGLEFDMSMRLFTTVLPCPARLPKVCCALSAWRSND